MLFADALGAAAKSVSAGVATVRSRRTSPGVAPRVSYRFPDGAKTVETRLPSRSNYRNSVPNRSSGDIPISGLFLAKVPKISQNAARAPI